MSKELIERLRADAESTDDIGLCADAADRIEELEREIERKMSAAAFVLKERDALQADNARLREAINRQPYTMDRDVCEALAATPEQSLAEYRNKVIEECYNALQKVMVTDHSLRTYKRCLDAIRAMKEPE